MHTEWHRLSGSRATPMRTLIGAFGAIITIVAVANVYISRTYRGQRTSTFDKI